MEPGSSLHLDRWAVGKLVSSGHVLGGLAGPTGDSSAFQWDLKAWVKEGRRNCLHRVGRKCWRDLREDMLDSCLEAQSPHPSPSLIALSFLLSCRNDTKEDVFVHQVRPMRATRGGTHRAL